MTGGKRRCLWASDQAPLPKMDASGAADSARLAPTNEILQQIERATRAKFALRQK
jgi:hypothetical protein